MALLLGGALLLMVAGLVLLRTVFATRTATTRRQERQRVIAEAEAAPPELLPEIRPSDVEAAASGAAVKVHVEVPGGEIISFRLKKRRLGHSYDDLCNVILQGVQPPATLSRQQLDSMEVQYEDGDGDVLVLSRASDFGEFVAEAQAVFVSKRSKTAGTRINAVQGPKTIGLASWA